MSTKMKNEKFFRTNPPKLFNQSFFSFHMYVYIFSFFNLTFYCCAGRDKPGQSQQTPVETIPAHPSSGHQTKAKGKEIKPTSTLASRGLPMPTTSPMQPRTDNLTVQPRVIPAHGQELRPALAIVQFAV
jgi:hypothetical protein